MTNEKTSPSKLMAILAFCAAVVGVIAFFLPMVSAYGIVEFNGMDLIDTESGEGFGMLISLIGAGAAVLLSLVALSNRKMLGATAGCAVAALAGSLYAFVSGEVIEYAAFGFWLFVVMEGACIILSFLGLNKAKAE